MDGVAGKDRRREDNLLETEIRDRRAVGRLQHRQPDEQRDREHAVDQWLAELGPGCELGVEVEWCRVHRHRREEHVVGLGHRASERVVHDEPDREVFEPFAVMRLCHVRIIATAWWQADSSNPRIHLEVCGGRARREQGRPSGILDQVTLELEETDASRSAGAGPAGSSDHDGRTRWQPDRPAARRWHRPAAHSPERCGHGMERALPVPVFVGSAAPATRSC